MVKGFFTLFKLKRDGMWKHSLSLVMEVESMKDDMTIPKSQIILSGSSRWWWGWVMWEVNQKWRRSWSSRWVMWELHLQAWNHIWGPGSKEGYLSLIVMHSRQVSVLTLSCPMCVGLVRYILLDHLKTNGPYQHKSEGLTEVFEEKSQLSSKSQSSRTLG